MIATGGGARLDANGRVARTVHQLAAMQLDTVSGALDVDPARRAVMTKTFTRLATPCGDQPLDQPPRWSGMTDDCSPVEWSVAFRRGAPDIRVLVEAQRDPASVASYWEASRSLTRWVVDELGADDEVLSTVIGAFEPTTSDTYAAAYHGIEFQHDGSVRTKVYLNPALAGDRWTVAREALGRIGLLDTVDDLLAQTGPLDLPLVAIDLEPTERARVKLYLRSPSFATLEAVGGLCEPACAADYRPFVLALYGDRSLPRPPFVALHLRAPSASHSSVRPDRAVLSIPVYERSEGRSTQASCDAIASLLTSHRIDPQPYRRVADALVASGPRQSDLPGPYGLHSWVSFQREPDGNPRVTVYFRLCAFASRFGWLGTDPVRTWPSPIEGER